MKKPLLLALIVLAIIPMQVGAYGVETHAAITQEIARFFSQHYPNRAFTDAEKRLLMNGSMDEDDGARPLNHFYDPVHKTGLTFLGQHLPSKSWAQDSIAQAGIVNNALALVLSSDDYNSSDYTWRRAIEDYARGKTERGLEGLGHILHLIEDLTVPAHVRNDPHPPKDEFGEKIGDDDPYELWSHKFTPYKTNILIHMADAKPISGLGSLNKYFDELAKYTNSRFFSKDTILTGEFSRPDAGSLSWEQRGKLEFLHSRDADGDSVIAWRNIELFSKDKSPISTDSDIISQSTWDRLSIKAVQYGAGVVDLFFNEVEKLKKDPKFMATEQKSLLGQFIDSVGENVNALIDGAPSAQPAAVVRVTEPKAPELSAPTPERVDEPAEVIPAPETVSVTLPTITASLLVDSEPKERRLIKSPKSSSGGDEQAPPEEVVKEAEPEPVVEPNVEPEPELIPEPEPTIIPETDITAPAAVADLGVKTVSESAVVIRWTAPGDDGDVGVAESYELRYGTSVITEEGWSSMSLIDGVLAPKAGGETEQFEVAGLSPMTTYYFALKAKDEAGNESVLSNVLSLKTGIAKPSYPVISEVYPDMVGADTNEFVELYNPTDAPINITGYSLQYLPGASASFMSILKKNFSVGATIPAKGFYLVGMWGNPASDMSWSEQLNNVGGSVFLVNDQIAITDATDLNIIDRMAYGSGSQPAGISVPLPGEGKSVERKALRDGSCVEATASGEFIGNGCDTNSDSDDFQIRLAPKGQRTGNLIEPRTAPTAVSGITATGLRFAWSPSLDAGGGSTGITYILSDLTDPTNSIQLYSGNALAFERTTNEIGRVFTTTFKAIDRDGMTSEPVDYSVTIPSYLKELAFYAEAPDASGSQAYSVRLGWENYPFIPGTTQRWHLVVFYYNQDAEKLPFLGQANTGHNWGSGVSMPSKFKTAYKNCFGGSFTTDNTSALILSDDALHCSGMNGGEKSRAIDFGLLRDKVLTLPVLSQTFGGVKPIPGESFVTVAFYTYADGNPLGTDMRLVAVDKTRYYLSE